MANTTLTASIIAAEAITILDNELVMAKQVFRGYENEFDKKINGYTVGEEISIRKPTDFTVRTNATMAVQDVTEGKTTIKVDQRRGVDFEFTSQDLTLKIGDLSERVIKPAMVQLANSIDTYLMGLYRDVYNWVGTPGQVINSYADFALAPERMDEYAVPSERSSVLSPQDHWGLLGSQTALYMSDVAKGAYRKGSLGEIGGVDTFMSQNVPTHIVGVATGTPLVNGANQDTTYALTKDTGTQTLVTKGWTNSVTGILKAGDVFTIGGVYAVNPVTKATLPFLKQFVVVADANSGASTGPATLTIAPAMIASGAFKNVSAGPADNAPITVMGTGGTGYRQNLAFHRNAFALVAVPMVSPPGAVDVARKSYKGLNVRVIPVYDGTNDKSAWRLDVLFGGKTIDPRLAVRMSGSA
ncbi:P22 phage major capsid protein family protein [Devosia sp.]|uniref:P22 phage major capsid protein family protein n=1 Tax=Devosia sp. TaxID=1871048 RepID=UPI002B001022|nr:P22 phage major capsid protein family protein [Devosia sp.]